MLYVFYLQVRTLRQRGSDFQKQLQKLDKEKREKFEKKIDELEEKLRGASLDWTDSLEEPLKGFMKQFVKMAKVKFARTRR